MEGNKDEAQRCLSIAQRHHDSGNIPSARKFCQKSINLFSTPEALKLLASINSTSHSSSEPSSSSAEQGSSNFTSGAEVHASASGAKRRPSTTGNGTPSGIGGEKRDFTPEQRNLVKRVRTCKVTDYYEILSVKSDCEEVEIKKAYRKVWLLFND